MFSYSQIIKMLLHYASSSIGSYLKGFNLESKLSGCTHQDVLLSSCFELAWAGSTTEWSGHNVANNLQDSGLTVSLLLKNMRLIHSIYWRSSVKTFINSAYHFCHIQQADLNKFWYFWLVQISNLSRGEICVANFLPPCEWGKSG